VKCPRNFHEESLLVAAAFMAYITAINPAAELPDRIIVYGALAVVAVYWATRTIYRHTRHREEGS